MEKVDILEIIAFTEYIKLSDEDIIEAEMPRLINEFKGLKKSLVGDHYGDCTKNATSCSRCLIESHYADAKIILESWKR